MEYLPLIIIPTIYFVVAMIKPLIQKLSPWNICAICSAVSTAWLIMLILWIVDVNISETMIGIMMGMSVTGIMYKAEALYKDKKIKNFWFVRLLMIVGGLYSIVLLLSERWSELIVLGVASFMLIVIVTFLVQGVKHEDVVDEATKKGIAKSLLKKLDNCC